MPQRVLICKMYVHQDLQISYSFLKNKYKSEHELSPRELGKKVYIKVNHSQDLF